MKRPCLIIEDMFKLKYYVHIIKEAIHNFYYNKITTSKIRARLTKLCIFSIMLFLVIIVLSIIIVPIMEYGLQVLVEELLFGITMCIATFTACGIVYWCSRQFEYTKLYYHHKHHIEELNK